MEIQGGLIVLDDNKHLPIPWQLRAFLGLQTGARAYVGVTRPAVGTPPDVILSPIALSKLPHSFKLIVSHKEEKLSFNTVLGIISEYNNINIAIADSVTIEGRTRHVSTIVLEPSLNPPHRTKEIPSEKFRVENYDIAIKKSIDSISARLNEKFGPETVTSQRITAPSDYLSLYPVSIESGFVQNSDWHSRCINQISIIKDNNFDINKLVCSGNTENCYIRYIFPLKNPTEISLLHMDTPGALESVTSLIGESGYNILSSRLSRTPPRGYGSEISKFVAICEPTDKTGNESWFDLENNLEGRIQDGNFVRFGIDRPRRNDAVPANKSVYFQRPGLKSIAMPSKFSSAADRILSNSRLSNKKMKIFICYKFFGDEKSPNNLIVKTIKDIIAKEEMDYIAADVDESNDTTYDYIQASLWLSDACIVLAFNKEGKIYTGNLSVSQTHEIGFMLAKPNRAKYLFKKTENPKRILEIYLTISSLFMTTMTRLYRKRMGII